MSDAKSEPVIGYIEASDETTLKLLEHIAVLQSELANLKAQMSEAQGYVEEQDLKIANLKSELAEQTKALYTCGLCGNTSMSSSNLDNELFEQLANLKAELEVVQNQNELFRKKLKHGKDELSGILAVEAKSYFELLEDNKKLRAERDLYLNAIKEVEMAPRILHKDNLSYKMQLIADMALSEGAKLADSKDKGV